MSSIDAEAVRVLERVASRFEPQRSRLELYAKAVGVNPDHGIEGTAAMTCAALGIPDVSVHKAPMYELIQTIAKALGDQKWARHQLESQLTLTALAKSVGVAPQTIRRAADTAGVKRPDEGKHHSPFTARQVRRIAEHRSDGGCKLREQAAWNELLTALGERTLDKPRKARSRM